MPNIDFPSSPYNGQTYVFNGNTWTYNGVAWVSIGSSGPQGPLIMLQNLMYLVIM